MKTAHVGFCLVLSIVASAMLFPAGCSKKPAASAEAQAKPVLVRYHCPMHPEIISDKPGDCPICGMALVLIESETQPGASTMPGLAPVVISAETRQLMGLTLGTVEKRAMNRVLRLPARIVVDESRQARVTTKWDGFVEDLFVSVTGQIVKKGDPLLAIYSPQWVAAQEEYRVAVKSGMKDLMAAARTRLQSWDVTEAQIAALEKTNKVERTLVVFAPSSGLVTEKTILAGQKIMPGESLLVVTDCSTVWALADVNESDLPFVRVGLPVELGFPLWPGKTVAGEVSFLPPTLDSMTHTLKARLTVPNPELAVKLGMYAEARLTLALGERVVIPETAVIQTGTHSYVFRDEGEGKLTPVEIRVGQRNEGWYEVLAGVKAGDRVVISANFLVDSESSIRAALNAHEQGGKKP